ncbi:MAG: hypothetical protein EBR09_13545 [Proteobacteria bacterium]|nr:hypothetical protein [Pseudomonadota bacterium]
MIRKIFASLSVTCAFLAAANARADYFETESTQPNASELAYMGYQGMFQEWGLPSDGAFCADVNNRIMIAQDLAYAYLLHIGHVDALLRPAEGAPVSQGQTQSQAQVKGKDIPVSQGQTQSQAQVKGKDIPVSQGQSQTQAQVKGKDIPVSQGQSQTQAQVKGKDIPVSQGQTQSQAQVKGKDIPVSQGQSQTQAQAKGKDLPMQQNQAQAKIKDTSVSQAQGKFQSKGGKLLPVQQQSRSQAGVMLSDLNLRRFVDYTNALTDDEVRLVQDNFDNEFLNDLYLRMRDLCRE